MFVEKRLDRERVATYSLVVGAYNYETRAFNETSRARQRNVDGMISLQWNSRVCFSFSIFRFLFYQNLQFELAHFGSQADCDNYLVSAINTILSAEGYLYDTSTVSLAITDINDNAPTFIRPIFTGGKETNGCRTFCIVVFYHACQYNFTVNTLWRENKAPWSMLHNVKTASLLIGFLAKLTERHRHKVFGVENSIFKSCYQ